MNNLKGVLHLLETTTGELFTLTTAGDLQDTGFTPSERFKDDPPLYSFYRGKIVSKNDTLGGFFVDTGDFTGFLPFNYAAGDRRVGDFVTLQLVRERIEDKPPRLSEKFIIPLGGCTVVFDRRGKVETTSNSGNPEGAITKEEILTLKELAKRYGLSFKRVSDPALCLKRLKLLLEGKVLPFISKPPEGGKPTLLFRWKAHYTAYLEHSISRVETLSKAPAQEFINFVKLWEEEPPPVEIRNIFHLARSAMVEQLRDFLFEEKFPFDGGFLLIKRFEGFTLIDVNGSGNHFSLNLKGFQILVKLVRLNRLGGTLIVDPVTPKTTGERRELKRKVVQLFESLPYRCKVFGFTNGGLFEISCPVREKPLYQRLGERPPFCPSGVVSNGELFTFAVASALLPFRGNDVKIKVHPWRESAISLLAKEFEGNIHPVLDWKLHPDRFEIL